MLDAFISAQLFASIRSYIVDLIHQFGYAGMARAYGFAVAVGTVMLTIWFMWQGYRLATGQSRDSMQAFLMRAISVITILSLAQGMTLFGQELSTLIIDDLRNSIASVITGDNYRDPADMIGKVITQMLILQTALDVYQANGGAAASNISMANFLNFCTGLSQTLPALIAGGLMLLNEIALHLCLVVAPLCILAYVYEPTRFIFVNWLKFTIATLFSMVIISVVTVIALRAIIVLIAALIAMDLGNSAASAPTHRSTWTSPTSQPPWVCRWWNATPPWAMPPMTRIRLRISTCWLWAPLRAARDTICCFGHADCWPTEM